MASAYPRLGGLHLFPHLLIALLLCDSIVIPVQQDNNSGHKSLGKKLPWVAGESPDTPPFPKSPLISIQ